jgi:hypothetical protein
MYTMPFMNMNVHWCEKMIMQWCTFIHNSKYTPAVVQYENKRYSEQIQRSESIQLCMGKYV